MVRLSEAIFDTVLAADALKEVPKDPRQGQLAADGSATFDVQALPAGTCLVWVQPTNGQPLTSRFVEQ